MHAMSSSQIRDYSECVSMFKCRFACVRVWRRRVWVSDCLCQASHIKVASAPGKRFLNTWQNRKGWAIQQARDMGEGSKVRGSGHLGEKKLPKQLPGFIWPASNCPTLTCSLFFSLTNTDIHSFAPTTCS